MVSITEKEFKEVQERVKEMYKLFGNMEELKRKVWEREFRSEKVVYLN